MPSLLASLIAVLAFGCTRASPSAAQPQRGAASSPAPPAPAPLPSPDVRPASKVGALGQPQTWHGIGLRRSPDCECCGRVFPDSFGAESDGQLQLLKEVAGGTGRAEELGCTFPYSKLAFDRLRKLATERQVAGAALILLQANGEDGIDLGGGELAETFGAEYLVPVLERHAGLTKLLDPQLEDHVATEVCASAFSMAPGIEVDVPKLATALRRRGVTSLAKKIEETCAQLRSELTR